MIDKISLVEQFEQLIAGDEGVILSLRTQFEEMTKSQRVRAFTEGCYYLFEPRNVLSEESTRLFSLLNAYGIEI